MADPMNDSSIREAARRLLSSVSPEVRILEHGEIGLAGEYLYVSAVVVVKAADLDVDATAAHMAQIVVDDWNRDGVAPEERERRIDAMRAVLGPDPIPMVLWCPACGMQHIDEPAPEKGWDNPPHRSHECQACGLVWRPADVPTAGVDAIQTKGARDGRAIPHPEAMVRIARSADAPADPSSDCSLCGVVHKDCLVVLRALLADMQVFGVYGSASQTKQQARALSALMACYDGARDGAAMNLRERDNDRRAYEQRVAELLESVDDQCKYIAGLHNERKAHAVLARLAEHGRYPTVHLGPPAESGSFIGWLTNPGTQVVRGHAFEDVVDQFAKLAGLDTALPVPAEEAK